jgi:hypothetical protein
MSASEVQSLPKSSKMIPANGMPVLNLPVEDASHLLPKRDSVPPGESLRLLLRSPMETQVEDASHLLPIKVRIFQTHVLDPNIVASYASKLTSEIAYNNLSTSNSEIELSILLYLISRNEFHARNRLLGRFNPDQVKYSNFDGRSFESPDSESLNARTYENLTKLQDPLSRDEAVFIESYDREYQPYACVVFQNNIYRGHVYCWLVDTQIDIHVMNIMGIRSSVYHLVSTTEARYNFPLYTMSAIRKFALYLHPTDRIYLRVLSPFPIMQKICAMIGMKRPIEIVKTDDNVEWMLGVYVDETTGQYMNMDQNFFVGEGPVTSDEEANDHSDDYIIEAHQKLIGEPEFTLEIV